MTAGLDLSSVINDFARNTEGVRHVALLAADGLLLAASDSLDVDVADATAAATTGLLSLANALGRRYSSPHVQEIPGIVTIGLTSVHFLCGWIDDRGALAVVAERTAALGLVGHAMQLLVTSLGDQISPPPRPVPTVMNRM